MAERAGHSPATRARSAPRQKPSRYHSEEREAAVGRLLGVVRGWWLRIGRLRIRLWDLWRWRVVSRSAPRPRNERERRASQTPSAQVRAVTGRHLCTTHALTPSAVPAAFATEDSACDGRAGAKRGSRCIRGSEQQKRPPSSTECVSAMRVHNPRVRRIRGADAERWTATEAQSSRSESDHAVASPLRAEAPRLVARRPHASTVTLRDASRPVVSTAPARNQQAPPSADRRARWRSHLC
jgi:hypothetical protein